MNAEPQISGIKVWISPILGPGLSNFPVNLEPIIDSCWKVSPMSVKNKYC